MAKESKLTEKAARFSNVREQKRDEEFEQYRSDIVLQNKEAAKALRFSHLLIKWFGEEPAVLSDYLKGVEKSVKTTEGSRILRGEIDALFGNAVIEFESDLNPKAKLHEAKDQLQGYVYAFDQTGKRRKNKFSLYCIRWNAVLCIYTLVEEC